MRLYHRTDAAAKILMEGFRESVCCIGGIEIRGVFLSDIPVDAGQGAKGLELLAVNIPDKDALPCELVQEGLPYREFVIPVSLIRKYGPPESVSPEEEEAAEAKWRSVEDIADWEGEVRRATDDLAAEMTQQARVAGVAEGAAKSLEERQK